MAVGNDVGRWGAAVCAVAMGLAVVTSASGASGAPKATGLVWSESGTLAPYGSPVAGLACPTVTVCAAVGQDGSVTTFDPRAGGAGVLASAPEPSSANLIACASATYCIAAQNLSNDSQAPEVTSFDPHAPVTRTPILAGVMGGNDAVVALTCASAVQCSIVTNDGAGDETGDGTGSSAVLTFTPGASGHVAERTLDAVDDTDGADAISCPTVHQCTVSSENNSGPGSVDGEHGSVPGPQVQTTFDPIGRSLPMRERRVPAAGSQDSASGATACPTIRECVMVLPNRSLAVFSPTGSSGRRLGVTSPVSDVRCPAAGLCVALRRGRPVAFDPRGSGSGAGGAQAGPSGIVALACPSATECVGMTSTARVFVATRRQG